MIKEIFLAPMSHSAGDNRGPDRKIISTVKSLNEDFKDITFVLATPSEFFHYMKNKQKRKGKFLTSKGEILFPYIKYRLLNVRLIS